MKFVIHIGTEKTGSTSIQRFLYGNRAVFAKHGYALLNTPAQPNNAKLPHYFVGKNEFCGYFKSRNIHSIEQKEAFFQGFEDMLLEEVAKLGNKKTIHTIILTSEHFHSRLLKISSIRKLKSLLDQMGSEFQIICYFREQTALVKSAYSTAVISGSSVGFKKYVKRCYLENHYFNYLAFFGKWDVVFGKSALFPRIYHPSKLKDQDVRKDFLEVLNCRIPLEELKFSDVRSNRRLGKTGFMMIRLCNWILPMHLPEGGLNPRRNKTVNAIINSPIAYKFEMKFPSLKHIFQLFEEQNIAFGKKYFDIDGSPFPTEGPSGGSSGGS